MTSHSTGPAGNRADGTATGMPPRRRVRFLAGIVLVSAALAALIAAREGVPAQWAVAGLGVAAAIVMLLVARVRPLDRRLAIAAIALMALRLALALVVQLGESGLTVRTLMLNVGLPAFFLYYLISGIREIQREPAAA